MAHIDQFIQAIRQHNAERLVLATGERILMEIGGKRKPVSAKPATREQIEKLLEEILPAERSSELLGPGDHQFPYTSPSGAVLVQVSRGAESLQLRIEPSVPEAPQPAPAAAPTPVVAAAPAPVPVAAGPTGKIDALFHRMVGMGCSDLHVTAGNPPLVRKDGEILPLGEDGVLEDAQVRELLMPIAPPRYREEFVETHDTDFAYEVPGVARFRCNFFQGLKGMGGVFRVIPTKIPTAEELGLPPAVLELCHLSKGLVLVTGPTGSGKSTTLAAMVDYINRKLTGHILTIEDPIEFVHANQGCLVNQREIGAHTEGFKKALRAALREDPDIVLVGEMRDLETVAIAIETAETGHLVFGTLHTNTAPSTVDRVIDQFPADRQAQVRTMLAESLKGVLSQTLCKKTGGGRIAAIEVLLVNSAISNLIREGKTFQIPSIMQTGRGLGMTTLNDSLLELVQKNLVKPEDALAKAIARSEFRALLERNQIPVPD